MTATNSTPRGGDCQYPPKVGDVVYVHDANDRRDMTRDDRKRVVTKVGRKLITVGEGWQAREFRIENQRGNGRWGHNSWFRTEAQEDEADRRDAALSMLRELGLEPRMGFVNKLTAAELEGAVDGVMQVRDAQDNGSSGGAS